MAEVARVVEVPNIRAERFALLTGPHTCYKCGGDTRVSAIGLAGYDARGEEGYELVEDCVLFTQLGSLGVGAMNAVATLAPWMRFDHSMTADATYLANHCEHCDALIGAWYIAEPGEAFFPQSEEEMSRLTVDWIDQPFKTADVGGMQSSWIDQLLAPDRPNRKPRRRSRRHDQRDPTGSG